jgi:hypothetical protein
MGLDAADLIRALGTCSGEEPDGPAETVALVRQSQPSFAPTLYAAWQAAGEHLSAGLSYDLDAARARIGYYRSVAGALAAQVPALTSIKGLEVADLYPAGLVRAMNDLDYIAANQDDLWRATTLLLADGWSLDTATFSHLAGALQVMVSLRRSPEDPYLLPYGIEIATYYALGNLGGVPPVPSLPPAWQAPPVKNLLMLLFERFEQPYRARDLIDADLLLSSARGGEQAALHQAIGALRLGGEYAELARLVSRAGLGPLPAPASGWARGAIRARRLARGAGFFRRPVAGTGRHLQRRLLSGKSSSSASWAWVLTQRLLPVAPGVRAGLLAFGLPIDGPPPPVSEAVLRSSGKVSWADTPVGRFLLTTGDDVEESAVQWLSGDDPGSRPTAAVSG